MFIKAKQNTIYVKISKNKLTARHIEDDKEITLQANEPFTSKRLLVGHFMAAEKLLTKAIKVIYKRGWLAGTPVIIMHPLEMIEEGLCVVEERAIKELAAGAMGGVCKIMVWLGRELTDDEAQTKAKSA
jgi:hypothetical protein